jgi:hypothetical protein
MDRLFVLIIYMYHYINTHVMLIANLIPGCTYASGVFTIPVTALNNILLNDVTAKDSAELLVYSLLQAIYEKQQLGSLSQPLIALEVSNKAVQSSVWESPANTFNNCTLVSYLTSFNFSSSTLENGNNITVLP